MKLNTAVSKFLTNKLVLNIIVALALFNVIGYLVIGNINAVLYFIVFAVLIRYFSKNMIIILGVPLVLVNLLVMKGNIMEGMENNTDKQNETKNANEKKTDENQNKIDKLVKDNKNKPDTKTSQGLIMTNIDSNTDSQENPAQTTSGEQQGFETGRKKNRGYDIDYATTIEDAYDELNNILGSDGIQRLTSDTQSLMKQQMQLAEAMKGMSPVIKQIAPMVESLKGMMGQMGDSKEGLGSVLDLAKKFSSQTGTAN
jgi:hypothetical protein